MNAIENRQAYVFLEDGDLKQTSDEYYDGNNWLHVVKTVGLCHRETNGIVRRPVPSQQQQAALTEQRTDGMTVWDHYAIEYCNHVRDIVDPINSASFCRQYADAMMKARPK